MPTSTFQTGGPLPAIRTSLTPSAEEIIEKNHLVHHIFYGTKNFHNHLAHHVVSNVALGCDKFQHCDFDRLWKVYDSYLKKIPPRDNSVEINAENWKTYLGKERYYVNYLDFFKQQIRRDGIPNVIRKYALDPSAIPHLISGAVHPLIHVGFGIDTMDNRIASEGLAETCIHKPALKPVVDLLQPLESATPAVQILDVLQSIRADRKFDSAVKFTDENKTDNMLRHAILFKPYVNQWNVHENVQDVRDKMKELTETATMLLFASSRPSHPKSPVLDFFLMHVVTSSLSVRQLIPHLTLAESASLLRAHYATLLMYYGARGRPHLDRSYVLNYPLSQSWNELVRDALGHDDAHVPKVVRAMKIAEADWGEMDGFWIRGAQMVIDVLVKKHAAGDWCFDGMFDEMWE